VVVVAGGWVVEVVVVVVVVLVVVVGVVVVVELVVDGIAFAVVEVPAPASLLEQPATKTTAATRSGMRTDRARRADMGSPLTTVSAIRVGTGDWLLEDDESSGPLTARYSANGC
jgi:hypothetical protein